MGRTSQAEQEEEIKQQKRMNIMKDLLREIRSKGRMDAQNRWCVTELFVADCEKAWIHPGWEDAIQKWYEWLEEKKDEKEKVEDMHQQEVAQMSAEGSAGLLHRRRSGGAEDHYRVGCGQRHESGP